MDNLLTEHDLAARWQLSVHTIRKYRRQKRKPEPIKLSPKAVRYRLDDIIQYENEAKK